MAAGRRRADADDEAEAQADLGEVRVRDRGAVRRLSTGAESTNEAVELGQRAWDLFNAGDLDAFWALTAPDIVLATDARWPDGGEFRGREAFRRFLAQFLEAFSGVRFEHTRPPVGFGDDVALFTGKWVGLGAASGIETASFEFSVVNRLSDGVMAESRFFFDLDEAREFARSLT